MKKIPLLCFIIILNSYVIIAQCKSLIKNNKINYTIAMTSKQLKNGFIVSDKLLTTILNKGYDAQLYANRIDDLIKALNSHNCDFAANVILYQLSQREPISLQSIFISSIDIEKGGYKYNRKEIDFWRRSRKKEELEYWKNWKDVHTRNGKMIVLPPPTISSIPNKK